MAFKMEMRMVGIVTDWAPRKSEISTLLNHKLTKSSKLARICPRSVWSLAFRGVESV